ncbi:MAG: cyanophycinase [Deltaproteobacteria bacterium]|nr:cyanophycinase [Deltaproteobacteria bacterium]MBI3296195.1 cyanophycinase [Deltaproteobacteria bacterium]
MVFKLGFLLIVLSSSSWAKTHLLAFGGGGAPPEGIEKLSILAGGTQARYLYNTWASDDPDESVAHFHDLMDQYHPEAAIQAPRPDWIKDHVQEFIDSLPSYTGFVFSGGDQNRVMDVCDAHPEIRKAFADQFSLGKVFSGASAGLAIMSATMLTGEGDPMKLSPGAAVTRPGFGLLELAVLDSHFITRNRMQRLLSVLMGSQERYGIGVDERTGVYIEDGKDVEVIGDSQVVFIEKGQEPGQFSIRVLHHGAHFFLQP